MKGITPHIASEFCSLCDWAYQANQIHRYLFDNNQHADKLMNSKFGIALARLSGVTVEYAALQIAKLHDKAVVSGSITLSIDYVMTYGGWNEPEKSRLESIRQQLDNFASNLRNARNKALSHNDLAAILSGGTLGAFEEDADIAYFKKLEEFACIVSVSVTGKTFSYSPVILATSASLSNIVSTLAQSIDT